MNYQCIARAQRAQDHGVWPIVVMCWVLEVHRSGYDGWQHRQRTKRWGKRAQEHRELRMAIGEIHRNSKERYGAPRVTAELRKQGFPSSRGRVARRMKTNAIQAKGRRAVRVTTRSNHALASPNLLARNFTAPAPNRSGAQPRLDRGHDLRQDAGRLALCRDRHGPLLAHDRRTRHANRPEERTRM